MKALKICGWLFLAVSAIHCLAGIFSGEFRYPSMRAVWLTAISAVSQILSVVSFIIPAAAKGLNGDILTQLSDVEDEINGLITYDRRVVKIAPVEVKGIVGKLR